MNPKPNLHPGLASLVETGVMFLPAIPAYLWIWPRVEGLSQWVMQILAYLYVLAGTLWISVRHWNLRELGFTRKLYKCYPPQMCSAWGDRKSYPLFCSSWGVRCCSLSLFTCGWSIRALTN